MDSGVSPEGLAVGEGGVFRQGTQTLRRTSPVDGARHGCRRRERAGLCATGELPPESPDGRGQACGRGLA